jgi:FkbM family methyltransferase
MRSAALKDHVRTRPARVSLAHSSAALVKRALRRVLPERAVVRLADAHRRADIAAASALGTVLGALPLRVRALTRDRLASTGMLDYARSPIRLVVDSEAELPRLNSCRKEPETVAWIERFVRPGDVVFDIGANVGAYSLVVDRATGGRCTVYAFEPSFSTFAQLSRNVALNGSSGRVLPVLVALSDVNGLVTFNYSSLDPGTARHALGESVDDHGRPFTPALTQPVLTYRMDDFVAQFSGRAPHHIKLDVDGIELKVLSGGARTLADPALRTVLVEVELDRPELDAIQRLLEGYGFALEARHPHGTTADSAANFIFTRGATD